MVHLTYPLPAGETCRDPRPCGWTDAAYGGYNHRRHGRCNGMRARPASNRAAWKNRWPPGGEKMGFDAANVELGLQQHQVGGGDSSQPRPLVQSLAHRREQVSSPCVSEVDFAEPASD